MKRQSGGDTRAKLLQRLSVKQCSEYLVTGYIKENTSKKQYDIYPLELHQLSIDYLGHIFYGFTPSLIDSKRIKLINEHHAEAIRGDPHQRGWIQTTLLIDLPIPVNDDEININWKVKITANGLSNGHYFIGIVPDKYDDFDNTVWLHATYKETPDIYGVCGLANLSNSNGEINCYNIIWNGKRDPKFKELVTEHCKVGENNYKSEEIISCQYDGKSKQFALKKFKDEALICNMEISSLSCESIKYFYPAISLRDEGDIVQIIP